MTTILIGISAYILFATPFAIGLGKYLRYTIRRQTVRARV